MKNLTRYYCGNGDGMFESKTGHWIEYAEHLLVIKELKEQLHKLSVGGGLLPKCPNCQGTGIDPTIPNYNNPPNSKPEQLGNEGSAKSVREGKVINMQERERQEIYKKILKRGEPSA